MDHAPTGLSRRVQTLAARLDPAHPPDGELLARWHAGRDEAAFAELVRRHGRLVWGVCRRATADEGDAYQAVFLLLANRAGRLTGRDTVAPWLHLTAVRVSRRAVRTAARRRAKERAAARPEAVSPAEPSDWRPVFDAVLAGLPARYRDAMVLCELGGLPRADAAARLGILEGTLASRLAAARVLLRNRLARRGVTAGVLAVAGSPPAVTAGVAGEAAKQLARGVTMMLVLKKLVAGLAVAGALIGVGTGVAARPVPVAADITPPGEPAWKAEVRTTYGLAEGQAVRRVSPPLPAVRERFLRAEWPARFDDLIPISQWYHLFRWRDGWVTDNTVARAPISPDDGLPLAAFLEAVTRIPAVEQQIDPALDGRRVTGEFVVRDEADRTSVLAALVPILRDECRLPVALRVEPTEREVYVVGGRYDPRPLGGRPADGIDVFAHYRPARGTPDDARGTAGAGPPTAFVAALGEHLGRSMRYEVQGPVPIYMTWRIQVRLQPRHDPASGIDDRAADRDPEVVLRNVSVQTGLTFTKEKRKVQVLVAEPAK